MWDLPEVYLRNGISLFLKHVEYIFYRLVRFSDRCHESKDTRGTNVCKSKVAHASRRYARGCIRPAVAVVGSLLGRSQIAHLNRQTLRTRPFDKLRCVTSAHVHVAHWPPNRIDGSNVDERGPSVSA